MHRIQRAFVLKDGEILRERCVLFPFMMTHLLILTQQPKSYAPLPCGRAENKHGFPIAPSVDESSKTWHKLMQHHLKLLSVYLTTCSRHDHVPVDDIFGGDTRYQGPNLDCLSQQCCVLSLHRQIKKKLDYNRFVIFYFVICTFFKINYYEIRSSLRLWFRFVENKF